MAAFGARSGRLGPPYVADNLPNLESNVGLYLFSGEREALLFLFLPIHDGCHFSSKHIDWVFSKLYV